MRYTIYNIFTLLSKSQLDRVHIKLDEKLDLSILLRSLLRYGKNTLPRASLNHIGGLGSYTRGLHFKTL